MNSDKVLLFGGSGFLGVHIFETLMDSGYDVYIADISKNSVVPSDRFFHCNIMSVEDINHALNISPSYVFNLAGVANLDHAVKNPCQTMNLNVMGNLNILNACLKHDITRYIYASSAYALSKKGSFYGLSKFFSEKIVEEFHDKYDLPFTIVRFGSVYSEKNYSNNYVFSVIKQAIVEGKITHNGDGEEIREYIHAADAARLCVDILKDRQFENEHIILTGVERMKRKELFLAIDEILGNSVKIEYKKDGYESHYSYTPYSFEPVLSKKLVANPYIDIGQGMVECAKAVFSEIHREPPHV